MKTLLIFLLLSFVPQSLEKQKNINGYFENDKYVVVRINPAESNIITCYQNKEGEVLGNFERLNDYIKSIGHDLIFACNGGMFMEDLRPLGLYVEDSKQISPLNTRSASTNFYIKPNGVFYVLNDGTLGLCLTEEYHNLTGVKYATQSGPMLTIDGKINPKFSDKSTSYNMRNGVGIDRGGKVIFILSKERVNFYDLAYTFQQLDCDNSLFLDGGISQFYCPEVGINNLSCYMSVMITVIK